MRITIAFILAASFAASSAWAAQVQGEGSRGRLADTTVSGYQVKEAFRIIGPGSALELSQSSQKQHFSVRGFDVDDNGNILINIEQITMEGWRDISAEEAFEAANGKGSAAGAEFREWKKDRFAEKRTASDEERSEAWDDFTAGPQRRDPGIRPVYQRETLGFRMSMAGKLLDKAKAAIAAKNSMLIPPEAFASDDPRVAWFNANIPLKEYKSRRREVKYRSGAKIKTMTETPYFEEGSVLGEDMNGNRVYLMRIDVPFTRKHIHGTTDFVYRVYCLGRDQKVRFSAEAYPNIRMNKRTGDLYEVSGGAYEGLMPAIGDSKKSKVSSLRIWRAK
ncbi:MAG: hypothetical protein HY924_10625 [Elusimicrobia bacterium]|nr:hypothetical protein [Elusimicrobiota bacterium]